MAKIGSKLKDAGRALSRLWLACALTLAPGCAFADEGSGGDEEAPCHPTRAAYLHENVDQRTAPVEEPGILKTAFAWFSGDDPCRLEDSGHTLYLKSTLLDGAAAGDDMTFDAVYGREDWMDLVAGQYDSCLDLLDPGCDSPYLVALANAQAENGVGNPTDHVFTAMTNEGDVIEDALFDEESGIAYVPKRLYEEEGEDAAFGCQLQTLTPITFGEEAACLTDVDITCHDFRVEAAASSTVSSQAFDVTCMIPVASPRTAAFVSLPRIHMRLNGSEEELALKEGENARWDSALGVLELAVAPQTLLQVEVEVDAPGVLGLIAEPAQATATSSLSYVPDVVFDRLNPDTLTPGRKISFTSNVDYWWPNTANASWQSCVSTGPYCYSWIHDPNSLYEYIAWAQGADWSGVADRDVSSFIVDPNGNQASRNYFNYIFEFGGWQLEDQDFHSDRWPITNEDYSAGCGSAAFGLQCSHAKNPVGDPLPDGDVGRMALRILEVNQEAARPYVVIGFVGPSIANQPGVGIYKFEIKLTGKIEVAKTSALPELTEGNATYSTDGIIYDVFADPACRTLVTQIRLDAQGRGLSDRLKGGVHYLRENAASLIGTGFTHDKAVRAVTVSPGKTAPLAVSDIPQSYHADLIVRKVDSVTANSTPQGDGTLVGAEFEARHYRERFSSPAEAQALTPSRTWRFLTDANGCISFDREHAVGGDEFYRNSAGEVCLPLGTLTIQETKAPTGYLIDETMRVIGLPSEGQRETIEFVQEQTVADDIQRGDVLIEKRDAESGLQSALGAADLDGTTFQIRNDSEHDVCVRGVMHAPGEVVATITATGGVARTEDRLLPFGAYTIQETAAGPGYLASDGKARTFTIDKDGCVTQLVRGAGACDQVKRGDLDLRKIRETDQSRLARVPFLLTSQTTGEAHVVVTDENGIVDTSATWNPHTRNTNGNDAALAALDGDGSGLKAAAEATGAHEGAEPPGEDVREPGIIYGSDLDPEAGLWFGKTADGGCTQPDDSLGALPYDAYTLTELRSDANEGLELVTLENIKVTAHGLSIPLGDIEDRVTPPPAITTSASAGNVDVKQLFPNEEAAITDRIDYCNLMPGRAYTIRGRLVDGSTGDGITDADGDPVTSERALTPANPSGSCEVAFIFDATQLSGKRLVCFEEVIDQESGKIICSHEELSDSAQSVTVVEPRISTFASDAATGEKEAPCGEPMKIIDAVSYQGLEAEAEYTLTGALMKRISSEEGTRAEPVTDAAGEPITSSITFAPELGTGRTSVAFEVDGSQCAAGAQFVVYETLTKDGRPLVVHENPLNDAQTITFRAPREEAPEPEPVLDQERPPSDETPRSSSTLPQTGDRTPWAPLLATTGAAAIMLLILWRIRKRRPVHGRHRATGKGI